MQSLDARLAPRALTNDELWAAVRQPRMEPLGESLLVADGPTSEVTSHEQMTDEPDSTSDSPQLRLLPEPDPIPPERLWYFVKPSPLRPPSPGERVFSTAVDLVGKAWNLPN